MRHKNHVSLIGTAGKDAEVRQTQGGVPYARFSLATSSGGYQKQDGTQVPEKTEWHNITAWRELADFCGKYVKKGMKVDVEGMITYGGYQDQQGQKRLSVEIVAKDIILMSQPQQQQPQQQGGYQQGGGYQQRPQQQPQNAGYQNSPQQGQQQMPPQGGYQVSPFPPQVNAQGQPVYGNPVSGYQPPAGGSPTVDDLPF